MSNPTISQGEKIRAIQFTNIYNDMISILGTGSVDRGYGQTPNSVVPNPVTDGVRITRAQWANLRIDLLRIAGHQGLAENPTWTSGTLTSIPTLPTISATTRISANVVNKFSSAATVLKDASNVFKLGPGQFSDEPFVTSTRTTNWNGTISHHFRLNFSSSNQARHFFNAGGRVRIKPTFSPSVNNQINNDWLFLVGNDTTAYPGIGTISFGHTNTTRFTLTSSETEVSSIGFYDLTSTGQQIFTRSGGTENSFYAVNDYTIRVFCNVANNSTGTASTITFECEFKDDKGFRDPLFPTGDEPVQGTTTNAVTLRRPTGSNVEVVAPTNTNILTL